MNKFNFKELIDYLNGDNQLIDDLSDLLNNKSNDGRDNSKPHEQLIYNSMNIFFKNNEVFELEKLKDRGWCDVSIKHISDDYIYPINIKSTEGINSDNSIGKEALYYILTGGKYPEKINHMKPYFTKLKENLIKSNDLIEKDYYFIVFNK